MVQVPVFVVVEYVARGQVEKRFFPPETKWRTDNQGLHIVGEGGQVEASFLHASVIAVYRSDAVRVVADNGA